MKAVHPGHRARQTSGLSLRLSRLLVWGGAIWLAGLAQAVASDIAQVTRFQRTVQYLQDASPQLRSEFAAIALSKLASAYFVEAKLAREEARRAGQNPGLRAWSITVDRYANQMSLLLQDIDLGFPVSLALGSEKSLAITVADRTVILSHPRLYEQNAFEQGVLVAFCARHRCDQFAIGNGEGVPIPVSTQKVRPHWAFTSREWTCSYHGIKVRFDGSGNMAKSRLICEQFLREVITLADELAWQQRHNVSIEWDQLVIKPTPRRPEHMLQLNALGDTVLVTVPMLYSNAVLFGGVLPWIRQRVTAREDGSVDLDADQYDWQIP